MSADIPHGDQSQIGHLHGLLAKKLQGFDTLSDEELRVLQRAMSTTRVFEPGTDLVSFGDNPTVSTLVVEGWAARYRTLENGARQITAIHIPGDFVDLHSFLLRPMDHSVAALSVCRVAMFPHDRLQLITEKHPHLTRLLWLNTLIDAAMHREWLTAMGRLPVVNQLAHLICELYQRLDAVDLIKDRTFEFPVTQAIIADTLGVSLVQMNRSLQDIRARGLLSWQQKKVKILDWEGLKDIAQFDATYLHQIRRSPNDQK